MSCYDPDEATAREDMCRFLSACFYEPGPEFAEEDLFGSMATAAGRIHPDMASRARALGEAFSAEDPQALLVDYTRLFLGPVEALAKPYESCWRQPPVAAQDVRYSAIVELYSEGGFDIDEEFSELPDHIAVELEFLYLLMFRRNDAQRAGQTEEAQTLADLERKFLGEHLCAWIGPFADAIRSGARTEFYRQLAALAEQFVASREADLAAIH